MTAAYAKQQLYNARRVLNESQKPLSPGGWMQLLPKPLSCRTDLMFLLVRSQSFPAKINLFLSCHNVSLNFMPSGGRIQGAFENAALSYFRSEFSWFPSCVS